MNKQLVQKALFYEGAYDIARAYAGVRIAIENGMSIRNAVNTLKKNQPQLFGPNRSPDEWEPSRSQRLCGKQTYLSPAPTKRNK